MPCLSLLGDGQRSPSHSMWAVKPQGTLLAAPWTGAASAWTQLQVRGLDPFSWVVVVLRLCLGLFWVCLFDAGFRFWILIWLFCVLVHVPISFSHSSRTSPVQFWLQLVYSSGWFLLWVQVQLMDGSSSW